MDFLIYHITYVLASSISRRRICLSLHLNSAREAPQFLIRKIKPAPFPNWAQGKMLFISPGNLQGVRMYYTT